MKGWYGNKEKHSLASKGIRTKEQSINEHLNRQMGSVEVSDNFGRLRKIIKKQLDEEIKDYGINPDDFKFSLYYDDEDEYYTQAEYLHNFRDIKIIIGGIWFDEDNGEILQKNIITLE